MANTLTWEDERAERTRLELERHRELLAIGHIAAAHLNGQPDYDNWTIEDEKIDSEYPNTIPDRIYLVNTADGSRIILTTPTWNFKGKIEVRGVYDFGPKEYGIELPGKYRPAPSISVTMLRGGVAVAKALMSRFLPIYYEITRDLAQRIAAIRDDRKQNTDICERMAAILGCSYSPEASMQRRVGYNRFSHSDARANKRVEVYSSNGIVDLKLENLPEALAAQVLEIVAPHLKGGA